MALENKKKDKKDKKDKKYIKKVDSTSKEGTDFYKLSATDYNDNPIDFSIYKGKMLLITNMASTCGLAKNNLSILADILTLYKGYGLEILIFPCLQYSKDDTDILKKMYNTIMEYSDKFTVFGDTNIVGNNVSSVYKHLIKYSKGFIGNHMKWNFAKFIINEQGCIIKKYEPGDRIEVEEKIFKRLLLNEKEEVEREVVKYEGDPYDIENSSEEELYY